MVQGILVEDKLSPTGRETFQTTTMMCRGGGHSITARPKQFFLRFVPILMMGFCDGCYLGDEGFFANGFMLLGVTCANGVITLLQVRGSTQTIS